LIRLSLAVAVLASLAGCGDDSAVGGGPAGGGGEGGADPWEAYCTEVYCPQRTAQAAATGCDPDPECELGCLVLAPNCRPEIQAVQACAETAALQCYPAQEGTKVDVSPGECASELNALNQCAEGACEAFDDAPCSALACEDDTILRFCEAGVCSSTATSACDAERACTSEDFVDTCPTIACDGGVQQGCLPAGFCQVTCI
jgi:hypothetical protein